MILRPDIVAVYLVDPSLEEPKYLLVKRKGPLLAGVWQMVTGHVEVVETAAETAFREVWEETGFRLSAIYNVDITPYYNSATDAVSFCANFCAFVDSRAEVILAATEHSEYRWVAIKEVAALLALPAQMDTLAKIHSHFVISAPHPYHKISLGRDFEETE